MSVPEIVGAVIVFAGAYEWFHDKRVLLGVLLVIFGVLVFTGSVVIAGGF